jgi:hypothetical protein
MSEELQLGASFVHWLELPSTKNLEFQFIPASRMGPGTVCAMCHVQRSSDFLHLESNWFCSQCVLEVVRFVTVPAHATTVIEPEIDTTTEV